MKFKFLRANKYLYFDDELIELLEDYSKKGWKLKSMNPLGFIFTPTNKPLKYSIDYIEPKGEYNEIIEQLGYVHIYTNSQIHIYANENLNAEDLHTDPEIHNQVLLKKFNKLTMFTSYICGLIFIYISYIFGKIIFKHDLNYYRNFNNLYFALLFLLLGITLLSIGFYIYKRRKAIINNTHTFKRLNKYRNISFILLLLLIAYLIYIVKDITFIAFIILASSLISILPNYLSDYVAASQKVKLKRILIKVIACTIFIISFFGINYIIDKYQNNNTTLYQGFPNQNDVISSYKNRNLYYISFIGNSSDCNQEYYLIYNTKINNTIFKELIQETELYCREISQAQPADDPTYTGYIYIDEYDNEYIIPELEKYDYTEAIKYYQKYKSNYFKDVYILDNYIIARNDNIIVRLTKENSDVDLLLKQYIDYTTKFLIEEE